MIDPIVRHGLTDVTQQQHASDLVADPSRRTALRWLGGGGLAAALLALGGPRPTWVAAQDATPTAMADHAMPHAVGVTIEALSGGPVHVAPGYALLLLRLTFAPGAHIDAHHHAGPQAAWVASGDAFGYTLLDGEAMLTRAPVDGTPTPPEPFPLGTEVILKAGDSWVEQGAIHSARNAGTEPEVGFAAVLFAIGEPPTTFTNDAGTPVP